MNTKLLITVASQALLGATFLFSGFVKSVDIYGTAFKISDYLSAFHCNHLHYMVTPIAFFLVEWELLLGVSILMGMFPRYTFRVSLITMIFMSLLTLYIAIFNPVDDCGCFGDAFTLSNWGTFAKNLLLLICSFYLTNEYSKIKSLYSPCFQKIAVCYFILFFGFHLFYNYNYEPIFDFRKYRVGTSLIPISKNQQKININLVYEKDNIEQIFTVHNAPLGDSTWTYVRTEVESMYPINKSEIYDFALNEVFLSDNGVEQIDITNELLLDSGYSFMLVASNLMDLSKKDFYKFLDIISFCNDNEYSVYLLTSSTTNEISSICHDIIQHNMRICTVDYKTLNTIIRTNIGLFIMQEGKILAKWAGDSFLNSKMKSIEEYILEAPSNQSSKRFFILSIIFIVSIFCLKSIQFIFQDGKTTWNSPKVGCIFQK